MTSLVVARNSPFTISAFAIDDLGVDSLETRTVYPTCSNVPVGKASLRTHLTPVTFVGF